MNLTPLLNKAVLRSLSESDAREAALALMTGEVPPAEDGGLLSALGRVALPQILDRVRRGTSLPLAAGFGLSEPTHIQAIKDHADGAIVGSRLVDTLRRGEDFPALIRSFKQATRRP